MRQFIMSYSSARKQHVGAQEAFLKKYSISTMKEKEHEILIPFEFLATDEMANEYDMNPTLDSTGTAKSVSRLLLDAALWYHSLATAVACYMYVVIVYHIICICYEYTHV